MLSTHRAAYRLIWEIDGDVLKEDDLQIGQTVSKLTERDLLGARLDIMGKNVSVYATMTLQIHVNCKANPLEE